MKDVLELSASDMSSLQLLQMALQSGIFDLNDVQQKLEMKKEQEILKKHQYKMWEGADGRWRSYLPDENGRNGRKLVAKSSKELLEQAIIDFYGGKRKQGQKKKQGEKSKYEYTLEDIYPKWLRKKDMHTASSSYIRKIDNDWNKYYLNDNIVKIPLNQLKYQYLDEWAHRLVKEKSLTKTQYYNMSIIIRQCLEYAADPDVGLIFENPFQRVKINSKLFYRKPKPRDETQVYMENEQVLISNEALKQLKLNPKCAMPLAVILNFQLGLRIGELTAIKWEDVTDNYIHIQRQEITYFEMQDSGFVKRQGFKIVPYAKSAAGDREVYLNKEARRILDQIKHISADNKVIPGDYIFEHKGSRMTSRTLHNYLKSLCMSIGINIKSNHKIRKTYISSLFDCGVNINTIREQAGHEDERTSLHNYCFNRKQQKSIEDELEKAANCMLLNAIENAKLNYEM